MIVIIHGNGLTAASKKISEIKSQFDPLSIQEFSGKQIGEPFHHKADLALDGFAARIDSKNSPPHYPDIQNE